MKKLNSFQKLVLKVNDTTRDSNPLTSTNGTIWITNDRLTYNNYSVQTNSSGYFDFTFDPNCSAPYYQPNEQYWIAAVINDECYVTNHTNSTPTENFTLDIYNQTINSQLDLGSINKIALFLVSNNSSGTQTVHLQSILGIQSLSLPQAPIIYTESQITNISNYINMPEGPDGLFKTLHPMIHVGIIGNPRNLEHKDYMEKHKIKKIDLVTI